MKRALAILLFFALCAGNGAAEQVHWAFRPLVRPEVPTVFLGQPVLNPIDSFVNSKLAERRLTPSPPADPRALIRRIYFDLTGLPPAPEEIAAFQAGKSDYLGLVERLLSSPQYGERWARHWLDVVRFAETHGFEMNQPRPNAWLYRDYVIRAFNEDKPYDRFILEQIAGDVLGVDEATGFLVAGPWDGVKSPDPVLTANQRADELHDIVSTTSTAFLGLTVGCARCHDHKFDPIPQVDYYAMKAVFEGVQHGDRPFRSPEALAREKQLAEARRRFSQVEHELESIQPLASVDGPPALNRPPVSPRRNVERIFPVAARHLRFEILATTSLEPCIDELEVYTPEGKNVALASAGTKANASSIYPNSDIHRVEHLNDGQHGNSRSWISNEPGKGWVELEFPEPVVITKIVWGRDREEKFQDRLPSEYLISTRGDEPEWHLVASSYDRAKPGNITFSQKWLDYLSEEERARNSSLLEEYTSLQKQIKELARKPMVYAGSFTKKPEPTHRLHRGDPMHKREQVSPGALSTVPLPFGTAGLEQSDLSEDQSRRLALARWIANPRNPLTARVLVNRVWQHHFGKGLVATPSDFGLNGAQTTHPELLDWLASEFIDSGWSIKHVHRLILGSHAYRQRSASRPDCVAIDADARYLWRFPPRRLEAEPIRDSILLVSGRLDPRMGGPGFSFFEPNENYVRVYTPRSDWGPETFRRMVYGTVIRQRPDGVFGVFDCPDGGQIAPTRTSSTTPLQALNLLNSSFILQQAQFFAERLQQESGRDPAEQARRAFALAFGREPSPEELSAGCELVTQQGLTLFCRALFNANEFVYLF